MGTDSQIGVDDNRHGFSSLVEATDYLYSSRERLANEMAQRGATLEQIDLFLTKVEELKKLFDEFPPTVEDELRIADGIREQVERRRLLSS